MPQPCHVWGNGCTSRPVLTSRSPKAGTIQIATVDLTPPVFTGNTPYAQNKQATAFDLVVQQNKGGRVFYTVVEQVISSITEH